MARTTHCQCVGRGFEPRLSLHYFKPILMCLEQEQFLNVDYFEISYLREWGIIRLLEFDEEIPSYVGSILLGIKYGNRFMHSEAYMLCSAATIWPEFLYDSERPNYILSFEVLNNIGNQDLRFSFEDWFEQNRGVIADGTAIALGKEIPQI